MALPNKLNQNAVPGSTLASDIDQKFKDLYIALQDIFGVPDNTNISAAALELVAAGLKTVILQDAAADPTTAGQLRRNSTSLKYHDGTAARRLLHDGVDSVSLIQPGTILDFGGTVAPSGYLACDGAAVSRTTYAALFSAIGTTWGVGDGSTTFNVPNLARRTAVGSGGTGTGTLGNAVGNVGGAETHTLSTAEMPSHQHNIQGDSGGTPGASGRFLQGSGANPDDDFTQAAGSGGAHNNMQPSAVVLKIIKT